MEKIITCLIIDDDPDDHEIFQIAVQQTNLPVNCIYTFNCYDAISHLKATDISVPDFLFIDWNLSGMNGPECLFHLNHLPIAGSQVIFYSGCLPPELNQQVHATSARQFLKKSGSISQFTDELRAILGVKV